MASQAGLQGAVVPTRYWHRLEDGRIQCDVCPRFCKLNEGQQGLCFVRARQNDQIVLTTYGRSNRNKHRAVIYYLLVKHFGKEGAYA